MIYPYNMNRQDTLCVMLTIPIAVYTELILLMMSSKPTRNM